MKNYSMEILMALILGICLLVSSCTALSPYTHKFNGPGWQEVKAAQELSVYIDSVQELRAKEQYELIIFKQKESKIKLNNGKLIIKL